jgi:Tfp pilus assembly pilus retraction ATPase PilT
MLKEILQMSLDLKASDIILSANSAPSLKIM